MSFGWGIAAALAAPFIMTIGFVVWDDYWKGSAFALNLFKCNLASIGFLILSVSTRTPPFPGSLFTTRNVGFLILSAVIGIVIGDWAWLKSLKLLGARRVILMDSLKPFLAAVLGYVVLDEDLRPAAVGGIVLTVAGVLIVALEKTQHQSNNGLVEDESSSDDATDKQVASHVRLDSEAGVTADETNTGDDPASLPELSVAHLDEVTSPSVSPSPQAATDTAAPSNKRQKRQRTANEMRIGYLFSIVNAVLDTYGSVLIKQFGLGMTVWEINLIRFGFSGLFMLILSLAMYAYSYRRTQEHSDNVSQSSNKSDNPEKRVAWYALPMSTMSVMGWIHVSIGVLFVTFLTPSLSNYALFQLAIALALTLGSVGPLYSLPLSYLLQKQVPTLRACFGAVLGVAGIVVLAFRGTLPSGST